MFSGGLWLYYEISDVSIEKDRKPVHSRREFFVKLGEIFSWGGAGKLILYNAESRYLVVRTTRGYRAGMLQGRNMS